MTTPNPAPDAGRPTGIEDGPQNSTAGRVTNQTQDPDQNASGNPETATQSDLAGSDGAGIRGDYGDASQTNGLEGGRQQPADAQPDRGGTQTNADPETDTERTGS